MRHVAKHAKRFLTSEAGPTAVEYAVLLALIVLAAAATIYLLGEKVSRFFMTVGSTMDSVT